MAKAPSSGKASLPAPGSEYQCEGVTVEVPHYWPEAWSTSNSRVHPQLQEIIKAVVGTDTVYIRFKGHKGRYLKDSRKSIGLSDDGKRIMLQVMARVLKLKKDDPKAYEQVVERSPWMNPNHPDWVAYLFHKVYTLLPKRPPAPAADHSNHNSAAEARLAMLFKYKAGFAPNGAAKAAGAAHASPDAEDGDDEEDDPAAEPAAAPQPATARRGPPAKQRSPDDALAAAAAAVAGPNAAGKNARGRPGRRGSGALANGHAEPALGPLQNGHAHSDDEHDAAANGHTDGHLENGAGVQGKSDEFESAQEEEGEEGQDAAHGDTDGVGQPGDKEGLEDGDGSGNAQARGERPGSDDPDGGGAPAPASDSPEPAAGGAQPAAAAGGAKAQRPPPPAVPPPPQLPLPAAGQYYEFEGGRVEVPSYWPTDPKSHKTLVGRPLLLIINEVLGPNPANMQRPELDGRYLRERGTRPGSGLADIGKESMLRILCKVEKLKSSGDPLYQEIMERHPWLTPDHPDCIAYLWSKVLLFINTWGPAKQPKPVREIPPPRSFAMVFKRRSPAPGDDSGSSHPASPARRRPIGASGESGGSQPSSPVQVAAARLLNGVVGRRIAYAQAVVAAARRAQALAPPSQPISDHSTSSSESDGSETDDSSSSCSDTQVQMARSRKRPAARVVGLIPPHAKGHKKRHKGGADGEGVAGGDPWHAGGQRYGRMGSPPHGSWPGYSPWPDPRAMYAPLEYYALPPPPAGTGAGYEPLPPGELQGCGPLPPPPSLAQMLMFPQFALAGDLAVQRAAQLLSSMAKVELDAPGVEPQPTAVADMLALHSAADLRTWMFQVVRTFLLSCLMRCRPEDGTAGYATVLERMQARVHQLEAAATGEDDVRRGDAAAADAAAAVLMQGVLEAQAGRQQASPDKAAAPDAAPTTGSWKFMGVLLALRVHGP